MFFILVSTSDLSMKHSGRSFEVLKSSMVIPSLFRSLTLSTVIDIYPYDEDRDMSFSHIAQAPTSFIRENFTLARRKII